MELQFLPSHTIDRQKWDECLKNSINPLIYASPVYLDHMTDNWDAIIGDDYSIIMPVPWRKKYGVKYCYDVPFIQQLGVFGKTLQLNEIKSCLQLLHKSFRYGDYAFNYMNNFKHGKVCNNYMLSLASNYRSTSFFYSSRLQSDLSKAARNSFEYAKANLDEAVNLFRELYEEKIPAVTSIEYKNFYDLCILKEKENNLIVRKIISGKKVLAMNLLLKDKFRIYNLMPCTTSEGRRMHAGHFLYDSIIKEYSQTGLVFDFEGSDIPGVQHFYKNFGAISQPYIKIHFNRLPFPLNLFKS